MAVSAQPPESLGGDRWSLVGYFACTAIGIAAFLLIRAWGEALFPAPAAALPAGPSVASPAAGDSPRLDLMLHVLATLGAVLVLGYLLGRTLQGIGQPPVIGEVLAGILLGPSLLGAVAPDAMHLLVPAASDDPHGSVATAVQAIAQLGIVLFMFLVGLELNAARLQQHAGSAVIISQVGIVAPFLLGALLALALYERYAPAGVSFTSLALFLGVAMAITAFPVLARILTDRRLQATEIGILALSCAAADDVTAWCLLALVVGVVRAEAHSFGYLVLGGGAYLIVMFAVVRPLLADWCRRFEDDREPLPAGAIVGGFVGVLASALATEAIGIHAVFGAFLFGALIPSDSRLAREFLARLRDPVVVLLVPAFFAFTGMRTEIGLLSSWADWSWCGVILLVATLGKLGGVTLAARWCGRSWRESAAIGALMNTRGLMELIVLNVGLDLGVIEPRLFAMMVVMALATTFATSPMLSLLLPAEPGEAAA